jgi:hypothetical protein
MRENKTLATSVTFSSLTNLTCEKNFKLKSKEHNSLLSPLSGNNKKQKTIIPSLWLLRRREYFIPSSSPLPFLPLLKLKPSYWMPYLPLLRALFIIFGDLFMFINSVGHSFTRNPFGFSLL